MKLLILPLREDKGSGLWVRPSLFNHSCVPNCSYATVGDFLFMYTNRDVSCGSELCIPYLDVYISHSKRESTFQGWNSGNGFVCDCIRCSHFRQDPEGVRMEEDLLKLMEKAAELVNLGYRACSPLKLPISSCCLRIKKKEGLGFPVSLGMQVDNS